MKEQILETLKDIHEAKTLIEINDLLNLKTPDELKELELTLEELMAIESIKKLRNPFMMIDVVTVMKDLHICKSIAYRLFQREDFPSINIGKNNQIMLLPYMIWKMQKRV